MTRDDPGEGPHRHRRAGRRARGAPGVGRESLEKRHETAPDGLPLHQVFGQGAAVGIGGRRPRVLVHARERVPPAPGEPEGPVGEDALGVHHVGHRFPQAPLPRRVAMQLPVGGRPGQEVPGVDPLDRQGLHDVAVGDEIDVRGVVRGELVGTRPRGPHGASPAGPALRGPGRFAGIGATTTRRVRRRMAGSGRSEDEGVAVRPFVAEPAGRGQAAGRRATSPDPRRDPGGSAVPHPPHPEVRSSTWPTPAFCRRPSIPLPS